MKTLILTLILLATLIALSIWTLREKPSPKIDIVPTYAIPKYEPSYDDINGKG